MKQDGFMEGVFDEDGQGEKKIGGCLRSKKEVSALRATIICGAKFLTCRLFEQGK